MDAVKVEEMYTIDDIYTLPDGERAELIDGKIYSMAPPTRTHQRLVKNFTYQIEDYIRSNKGLCEVFPAPFAVFLNEKENTYVEPDISVICDTSKLEENGCHGAPDWIIEIVSPSSKQMDYFKKLFLYHTVRVKEYWAVDSDRKIVTVYNFEQDTMMEYIFGEEVPVGIYKGFAIKAE